MDLLEERFPRSTLRATTKMTPSNTENQYDGRIRLPGVARGHRIRVGCRVAELPGPVAAECPAAVAFECCGARQESTRRWAVGGEPGFEFRSGLTDWNHAADAHDRPSDRVKAYQNLCAPRSIRAGAFLQWPGSQYLDGSSGKEGIPTEASRKHKPRRRPRLQYGGSGRDTAVFGAKGTLCPPSLVNRRSVMRVDSTFTDPSMRVKKECGCCPAIPVRTMGTSRSPG